MNAFFTQSEPSKAAGRAYIERLKLRAKNRDAPVSKQAALAEVAAIREWGVIPQTDRFAMLGQIHHPTPIVHGSKDFVVMPINAFLLAEHLPNALSSSCTRMRATLHSRSMRRSSWGTRGCF